MKVRISVALSEDLLEEIDRRSDEFPSRSAFLEKAARGFLSHLAVKEVEQRDLQIINRRADALNKVAQDVLAYQSAL